MGGPSGITAGAGAGGAATAGAAAAFAFVLVLRAAGFLAPAFAPPLVPPTAGFRAAAAAVDERDRFVAAGFFELVTCTLSLALPGVAVAAAGFSAAAVCAMNPGGSLSVTLRDAGVTSSSLLSFLGTLLRFEVADALAALLAGGGGGGGAPTDVGGSCGVDTSSSDESELELSSSLLECIESLLDESDAGGGGGGDIGGEDGGGGGDEGGGGGGATSSIAD